MAQRFDKKQKRKSGCLSKLMLSVFCIVLAIGGLILFTDAEEYFIKAFYPIKYTNHIDKAAEKYNLDKALVYAVIKTESDFDPNAKSNAGAMGMMQMMPETFEHIQKKRGENHDTSRLFDPEISVDYGCYYLSTLLDYYGNEKCAIAAYNAGYVVDNWLLDKRYSDDGKTLKDIPYKETKNYVKKVMKAKKMYTKLYFDKNK